MAADWKVPLKVEAREGLTIWIEYDDGASGTLDLSPMADGPAFAGRRDRPYFESVHIDEDSAIAWGDDLALCADSLYIDLTGCSPEKVWPGLASETADV